jgi:hypothetical protein
MHGSLVNLLGAGLHHVFRDGGDDALTSNNEVNVKSSDKSLFANKSFSELSQNYLVCGFRYHFKFENRNETIAFPTFSE